MTLGEEYIWFEKYRPKTIEECILPEKLKKDFKTMLKKPGEITHLLFAGSQGIGKTTVARALANELEADFMYINASLEGSIDTIRSRIVQFSSSVSFIGEGRKIVLLDEADFLRADVQASLRGVFEEFASNVIFIMTCNFVSRIIEPLHSRCAIFTFRIEKKDRPKIAREFMTRVEEILQKEEVDYDKKIVAELIMRFMPDWRRVLNELQNKARSGRIDAEVLNSFSDESFNDLIQHMRNKKFSEVRKWIAENQDIDSAQVYRRMYDRATEFLEGAGVPALVSIIGMAQYKEAFVADKEVNMAAAFAEIMASVGSFWKDS